MICEIVVCGGIMKYSFNSKILFFIFTSAFLLSTGCSNSKYGAGFQSKKQTETPTTPTPTGKVCETYTPISGAYDSARRHVYQADIRFDKNSSQQGAYRTFMNDFGKFCKNNQGFQWQMNPNTGQMEYVAGYYFGVSNCSDWDDILKLWISFPFTTANRAHLTADSTMSGYPDGFQGQGYDTQRIQMSNAQIDCNVTDKTVIYYEPAPGFQFKVNIYQGNKSSERLRAEIFYKNASLGKADFFIVRQ